MPDECRIGSGVTPVCLIVERYSLLSASVDRSKASLFDAILNALRL
jgi:hypothetical protein